MFIAYQISCLKSGKSYIGVTKRSLHRRWGEHLSDSLNGKMTALHVAIREHGVEAFTAEEVCCAKDWRDVCEVEKILIEQRGTLLPGGYNGTPGGGHFSYVKTAESIERSAAKHRGKRRNPEATERAAQKVRGTVRSAATRAKIATARRGVKRPESVGRKISEFRTGRPFNVGESNGQAKLTAAQVIEARSRLAAGESQRSIARSFAVHYNAIWKIAHGLKWKSVA